MHEELEILRQFEAYRRKKAKWEPTSRDELEAALALAATGAGLNAPDPIWCEFLERAGNLLCVEKKPARQAQPAM